MFRNNHDDVAKISILLPSLNGGGAERTILKLAGGIASRGFAIDLVLARKQGPYLDEVPAGVKVIDLNAKRDLFSLSALVRYLRHERPIALLSGLHMNILAIIAKIITGGGMRVVVSERNSLHDRFKHYSYDKRLRLMPFLIRFFYPHADYVVAVSQSVADELMNYVHLPSGHIRVIYNPVVTPDLVTKSREGLNHPWYSPGEPPVILAAGRLTAQKDFGTLIKAFHKTRTTHLSRLLILGEGEERNALESLVSQLGLRESVSLPGFISNPYAYMAKSFVFVLSSRWEGLPGALIEAMYCGARLISTDCKGGSREILCNGKYGRLVPINNVDALAQAMISALNNEFSPPPAESWRPYELQTVVDQYLGVLLE